MCAKKLKKKSISQEKLLQINKKAFDSFDILFSHIESDLELVSCFVFCDSWLRGDDFPPALEDYVKDNFKLHPSRTIWSILGTKYRRSKKSIRWVYFLLKILLLNPYKSSEVPTYRNILFLNIKRFGGKPAEEIERVIGEPVTSFDLKMNISSSACVGGFECVVTRSMILNTWKELRNLIVRRCEHRELRVSLLNIYCGLLIKNAAYSFLKAADTYRVIVTGSLTNPHVRRIFYACELLHINSFLYITRNVSPVSIPMLAGMCNAVYGLPGSIFTKNMYSMSILNRKLTRGQLNISCLAADEGVSPSRSANISSSSDALFLLGLDKYFNFQLINFLVNNPAFSDLTGKIVIRPHPLDNIKAYDRLLLNPRNKVYFSKGGPLSSDLESKKVCYLYPSESFSEILENGIPICWIMVNFDLQAMDNIFWTSICGDSVNSLSGLAAHCKKSLEFSGVPPNLSSNALEIDALRCTRNPYKLIAGHLRDADNY